jgi:Tol biopolymer transport system component
MPFFGRGSVAGSLVAAFVAGCGTTTATPTPTPGATLTVTSISPNAALAGGPAFTLTVNGASFASGAQVQWNGSGRTTTFVSSSQLQAAITAVDLAAPGPSTVTVVNPGGGTSSGATFTVNAIRITFESKRAADGSNTATSGSTQNIWVMNPDGSSQAAFTKLTFGRSFRPAWSHDGGRIVFVSTRGADGSDVAGPAGNLWQVNADGSGLIALTRLTSNITSDLPSWSPDDSKILFFSNRALDGTDGRNTNTATNLWFMNPDGSGVKPLTKVTQSLVLDGVWSPDGTKIAYLSSQALDGTDAANSNGVQNLWIVNADGSGARPVTRLTGAGAQTTSFAWSPDGTSLITLANRAIDGGPGPDGDGTENLWVVKADGSSATLVTPQGQTTALGTADLGAVAWSPDGSKIAFISMLPLNGISSVNSAHNLWMVNPDGSGAVPLTRFDGVSVATEFPVWSADSARIFFSSDGSLGGTNAPNTNDTANIWVVKTDGTFPTALTRLTAAGASSTFPNRP